MQVGSRKFLNLVYAWCLKALVNMGKKPDEIEEWIRSLNDPLPGEVVTAKATPSPAELEEDARAFMTAMKQLG